MSDGKVAAPPGLALPPGLSVDREVVDKVVNAVSGAGEGGGDEHVVKSSGGGEEEVRGGEAQDASASRGEEDEEVRQKKARKKEKKRQKKARRKERKRRRKEKRKARRKRRKERGEEVSSSSSSESSESSSEEESGDSSESGSESEGNKSRKRKHASGGEDEARSGGEEEKSAAKKRKKKVRWARVQVKAGEMERLQDAEQGADYNIYYHRYLGDNKRDRREKAKYRCRPQLDSGMTRADSSDSQQPICYFFAQGMCPNGRNCRYYHRIPNDDDAKRVDHLHDVFGRERHATQAEDMDGVGSYMQGEGRTIWVAGMVDQGDEQSTLTVMTRHFAEFGLVEEISYKRKLGCAFVRYVNRVNAEFAKTAMDGQSLDNDETLVVRWAYEDPNPAVKRKLQRIAEMRVLDALLRKGQGSAGAKTSFRTPVNYSAPAPVRAPHEPAHKRAKHTPRLPSGVEAYPDTAGQYGPAAYPPQQYQHQAPPPPPAAHPQQHYPQHHGRQQPYRPHHPQQQQHQYHRQG